MQNLMQDDISRRFSIDSTNFKNSNSNLANSSVNACSIAGGFNRFNAISENEFEEPSVNQKFLQLQENPMNAMKRLSSLQDRNNRLQPHLRSSYALENLPADENQIKCAYQESKENRVIILYNKINLLIVITIYLSRFHLLILKQQNVIMMILMKLIHHLKKPIFKLQIFRMALTLIHRLIF